MPVNNRATLLANLNTYITSQVNPDTITPVILGGMFADIIDSMVDQLDQNVNGLTISQLIQNAIDLNNSNGGIVNPFLFRATKTIAQPAANVSGNTTILFEDDTTAPNLDNSNLFHTDRFIANQPMTKNFHVDGLKVHNGGGGGSVTFRIRFMKNGVTEIATTLATNHTTQDAYGHDFDAGYIYPSFSAINVTLAAGDYVTFELVTVISSGGSTITVDEGVFSNS